MSVKSDLNNNNNNKEWGQSDFNWIEIEGKKKGKIQKNRSFNLHHPISALLLLSGSKSSLSSSSLSSSENNKITSLPDDQPHQLQPALLLIVKKTINK